MDEQKVRKIVKDEMEKNYRSGTPKVPPHRHNGVDNLKISNTNILAGKTNTIGIIITPGDSTENKATYDGVNNPKQVTFYGIAFDTAHSPTQGKASLSGTAFLGPTNQVSDTISVGSSVPNVTQSNLCSFFHLSGGAWSPFVSTDNVNLCSLINESGDQIGSIQVVSWTNTSLTISAPLDSGWEIIGNITIT